MSFSTTSKPLSTVSSAHAQPCAGTKDFVCTSYEAMLDFKLVYLVLRSESVLLFSHTHCCSVCSEHAKHELACDSIYPRHARVERRDEGAENKAALRNLNQKWEPSLNLMPGNLEGDWGSFLVSLFALPGNTQRFWRGGASPLIKLCTCVCVRRLTEKVSVSAARWRTKTAFRSHLPLFPRLFSTAAKFL